MNGTILVPVDGSAFSRKAAKEAAKFAQRTGSTLVLFYAAPDYRSFLSEVFAPPGRLPSLREKARRAMESEGEAVLAAAAKAAAMKNSKVVKHLVMSDTPYEAIISAAKKFKCDLIVMASRGRHRVSGVLLGSETQKVLTHSPVPVLVVR